MRYIKNLLVPILVAFSMTYVSAEERDRNRDDNLTHHERELEARDIESLRNFIGIKRDVELKDKATKLAISGDVRTDYQRLSEKIGGARERGKGTRDCRECLPFGRNVFSIEANLYFDYATERAWAASNLQFDNSAGISDNDCCCEILECREDGGLCLDPHGTDREIRRRRLFHGSGECDDICLKRAYCGYNIWSGCGARFDVEIGRRKLYDVFESEIQFLSRFDGVLFKFSDHWENVSDWYIQVAGIIVDQRVNHYAYVIETAFYNIMDSNFDIKYSFIDWRKRGTDRCRERNPRGFQFANSQLILTYHVAPERCWGVPIEAYAAVLYNHLASEFGDAPHFRSRNRRDRFDRGGTLHGRKPWAWYAGITFGQVKKEGDWSLDLMYQWVQPHAIAYDDQNGIGLGNVREHCCGFFPTVGYKGWQIDALYALTDNLSIELQVQAARENSDKNRRITRRGRTRKHSHRYNALDLEVVYAF